MRNPVSTLLRFPRARQAWAGGILLAGGMSVAQASTGVACVLAARVQQVQEQPFAELMVKVQLTGVRDDNTHRNDVECSKHFRSGDALWVSFNARKFREDSKPKAGERIWLGFRYGDDRSGAAWRKYEPIGQAEYTERKNGIQ